MKKSFTDRIFPHPVDREAVGRGLSRNEETGSPQRSQDAQSPRQAGSSSRSNPTTSIYQSMSTASLKHSDSTLRDAPLGASLIHHNDPFLPIERTSKALQGTIQSLLDAQSAALGARTDLNADDANSHGSLTPTPSSKSDVRTQVSRTMPVRQPTKKKITLKSARNGLRRSMLELVNIREEELRLLDGELQQRRDALGYVDDFESRTNALLREIELARTEGRSDAAQKYRSVAAEVENEIQELEHRLLELKVKHRHLISQAEQIESSLEAKASSYMNTLKLVEKESKEFLRRPPVQQPFGSVSVPGMFALKPHRRTLQMAKEQWSTEQDVIVERVRDVESEHDALIAGERVWAEALKRITQFESKLRLSTTKLSNSVEQTTPDGQIALTEGLLNDLNILIQSLQDSLDHAQEQNWNLLVCALGAELHACKEAQDILRPDLDLMSSPADGLKGIEAELSDDIGISRTARSSPKKETTSSPTVSEHSNQSLQDTLAEFAQDEAMTPSDKQQHDLHSAKSRYESEDDEPPADFLLSR